jgi:GR25 family glycosyltransferase involved in LPS biosynthesis
MNYGVVVINLPPNMNDITPTVTIRELSQFFYHIHHISSDTSTSQAREENVNFLETKLSESFQKLEFKSIGIRTEEDLVETMARYPQVKILTKIDQNQDNSSGWIPGELGIWFSNYAAGLTFNAVSTTAEDVLLLFEDDVYLNVKQDGVLNLVPQWIDVLPDDWDYLNLYVEETQRANYDPEKHGIIDNLLCKNYGHTCAVAIAWSMRGIRKMIDLTHSGIINPIDIQIFSTPEFNGYTLLPDKQGGVSYFSELQYYNNSTIRSNALRISQIPEKDSI